LNKLYRNIAAYADGGNNSSMPISTGTPSSISLAVKEESLPDIAIPIRFLRISSLKALKSTDIIASLVGTRRYSLDKI